jgi:hypothetical protein
MAKTKPIGVRFDAELFEELKSAQIVKTYQETLNLLEANYKKFRDENVGISEERIGKPQENEQKVVPKTETEEPPIALKTKEALEEEIRQILAKKIPPERDTPKGRKAWEIDKRKDIEAIREQIKAIK